MKRQGFTLIELLAVIVILAIIALIAVPLILNVIDDAKRGAFKDSAYGISKSAEYAYLELVTKGSTKELNYSYEAGVEYPSDSDYPLNYNGNKPQSGEVRISADGKISLALFDGVYCAEKTEESSIIEVSKKDESECVLGDSSTPVVYTDNTGAPYPELSNGMIPITWNGNTWIKADLTQEWYNYENKEWANAVLVNNGSREDYKSAAPGIEIDEADVLAYLVWIPRYKYELFNIGSDSVEEQEIEITFQDKTEPIENGNTDEAELTHPAFSFNGEELNGFWVGKFETSTTIDSACYITPSTANCNNASQTPLIKPNVSSLRYQSVANQFATSQKFNESTYGLTNDNDAHMMKNTEWGAVAYLSRSKYGKNSEIRINNSSQFITGCAGSTDNASSYTGSSPSGCEDDNTYDTPTGQLASTTGNIYGIYDMSGGAWDRVMGNYNETVASSGINFNTLGSQYYDKYTGTSLNNRILGDATGEVNGWYGDYATFVSSSDPWFFRGGNRSGGANAGAFAFDNDGGFANSTRSFRVVLLGR